MKLNEQVSNTGTKDSKKKQYNVTTWQYKLYNAPGLSDLAVQDLFASNYESRLHHWS